jgi:tape measure domain-containing protein
MAAGPLDEAFIRINTDTVGTNKSLDGLHDQLVQLDQFAERVAESMEDSFREAGRAIERSLDQLNGRQLEDIGDGADDARRHIERAFDQAGRAATSSMTRAATLSDEALGSIGGTEAFAPVVGEAQAAAEGVEGAFRDSAEDADRQLAQIGGGNAFGPVVAESEVAAESVERSFRDAANDSERHLARLGSGHSLALLKTGLASVALGATAAAGALTFFGIKGAASLEQTTLGFKALLGSATEADSFIRDLQQFAANTPFEFQGLADNARKILAMGEAADLTRQDVIPLLGTIGDLTAVLAQPPEAIDRVVQSLSQIASKGKVSTEELLQIAEAVPGFPVFQAMADGLGISTAALQDQLQSGSIPAVAGINALVEGMKQFPGAAGAMADQAQTLTGIISTFSDTISLTLTQAFQPLIPRVKTTLLLITPLIQEALKGIAPQLADVGDTLLSGVVGLLRIVGPPLATFLNGIADGFKLLATAGQPALEAIGSTLVALAPTATQLGAALAPLIRAFSTLVSLLLPRLVPLFNQLVTIARPILGIIGHMASEFAEALVPALDALAEPLTIVIQAFGSGLVDVLQALRPQLPELAASLGELALALAQLLVAFLPLLPIVVKLASVLSVVLAEAITQMAHTLATMIGFLTRNKVALVAFATVVTALLVPAFIAWATSAAAAATASLAVASPVLLAVGAFVALAAALAFAFNHFGPFHDAVIFVRDAAISLWQDVLVPFATFIAGTFLAAAQGISHIFTDQIVPAFQTVIDVALALWNGVLVPFIGFVETVMKPVLIGLAVVVFGPLALAITAVSVVVTSLFKFVLIPFATWLAGVLVPIFGTVANVLVAVLKVGFDAVKTAALFLWNSVLVPFGNFLQSVFSVAVAVGKVALDGLKSAIGFVVDVAKSLWHSFLEPLAVFIKATLAPAIDVGKSAFNGIKSAIDSVVSVLKTLIDIAGDAFNAIKKVVDKATHLPGAGILGDIGEGVGKIGNALGLAHGGIITQDGLRFLHSPEVVIPTNNEGRALQLMAQSGLLDLAAKATGGGPGNVTSIGAGVGGTVIHINATVTGHVSPAEAREIGREIGAGAAEVIDKRQIRTQARIAS